MVVILPHGKKKMNKAILPAIFAMSMTDLFNDPKIYQLDNKKRWSNNISEEYIIREYELIAKKESKLEPNQQRK